MMPGWSRVWAALKSTGHLGRKQAALPGRWWTVISRPMSSNRRQSQLNGPQANWGFYFFKCWGGIRMDGEQMRVSVLCQLGKMFPLPNFSHQMYSLSYAWVFVLFKIASYHISPFDSSKGGGQISSLSPFRRWGSWHNDLLKWHKVVAHLGPDACVKVWRASHLKWQDVLWILSLLLPS